MKRLCLSCTYGQMVLDISPRLFEGFLGFCIATHIYTRSSQSPVKALRRCSHFAALLIPARCTVHSYLCFTSNYGNPFQEITKLAIFFPKSTTVPTTFVTG